MNKKAYPNQIQHYKAWCKERNLPELTSGPKYIRWLYEEDKERQSSTKYNYAYAARQTCKKDIFQSALDIKEKAYQTSLLDGIPISKWFSNTGRPRKRQATHGESERIKKGLEKLIRESRNLAEYTARSKVLHAFELILEGTPVCEAQEQALREWGGAQITAISNAFIRYSKSILPQPLKLYQFRKRNGA